MLFESECMIFYLLEEKKKDKNNFFKRYNIYFSFSISYNVPNL